MEATMEILTLKKAAEILGYRNRRSTVRWCINNGVDLINHIGSRRIFVRASQFYHAFYGGTDNASEESANHLMKETLKEKMDGPKPVKRQPQVNYMEYYKSRLLQKLNKL